MTPAHQTMFQNVIAPVVLEKLAARGYHFEPSQVPMVIDFAVRLDDRMEAAKTTKSAQVLAKVASKLGFTPSTPQSGLTADQAQAYVRKFASDRTIVSAALTVAGIPAA